VADHAQDLVLASGIQCASRRKSAVVVAGKPMVPGFAGQGPGLRGFWRIDVGEASIFDCGCPPRDFVARKPVPFPPHPPAPPPPAPQTRPAPVMFV
jgi:hypothetical protein